MTKIASVSGVALLHLADAPMRVWAIHRRETGRLPKRGGRRAVPRELAAD